MRKVKVEITGLTPLLMNSPASMLEDVEEMVMTTKKRDPKEEAEKKAYRLPSGNLYVPSEAIKGSIKNASAYKKFGKYSAKPIIAGSVIIMPNEIDLGIKNYEIDRRTVVVQKKSRIVRCRPRIDKWKLSFEIMYDDQFISNGEAMIKPILEEAGRRVGILDFRPQNGGSFGMFTVTLWKEMK